MVVSSIGISYEMFASLARHLVFSLNRRVYLHGYEKAEPSAAAIALTEFTD